MAVKGFEPRDPYQRCERNCKHELARGVSLAELLGIDGPHPDLQALLDPRPRQSRAADGLIRLSA